MTEWKLKRFWKETRVAEAGDGFEVLLDTRPVRTPGKAALVVPTRAMAEAMAKEWEAQDGVIDPLSMPVTRSANSAIDKVVPQFDEVAQMLAEYADSDLTCYRADRPEGLVARQAAAWDPMLDWAAETYHARLVPVEGGMYQPQAPEALTRLAAPLWQMTNFELTAMHDLVSLSGSLVLGLAVFDGHLGAAEAWAASRIDEEWQIEQWGADEEAAEAAEMRRAAFEHSARMLSLLRESR